MKNKKWKQDKPLRKTHKYYLPKQPITILICYWGTINCWIWGTFQCPQSWLKKTRKDYPVLENMDAGSKLKSLLKCKCKSNFISESCVKLIYLILIILKEWNALGGYVSLFHFPFCHFEWVPIYLAKACMLNGIFMPNSKEDGGSVSEITIPPSHFGRPLTSLELQVIPWSSGLLLKPHSIDQQLNLQPSCTRRTKSVFLKFWFIVTV